MYSRLAILALALVMCPAPPKAVGNYVKKGGNSLEVTVAQNDQVSVSLSGSYGMNTCQIDTGPQKIQNCLITYTDKEDGEECNVRISFAGRTAQVEQKGVCGCGLNVNLSGVYRKQSKISKKEAASPQP
jgi:hypothetical protein